MNDTTTPNNNKEEAQIKDTVQTPLEAQEESTAHHIPQSGFDNENVEAEIKDTVQTPQEIQEKTPTSTTSPSEEKKMIPYDQYLRLAADFQNFKKWSESDTRKRVARESGKIAMIVAELLDHLKKVISSIPEDTSWRDGLQSGYDAACKSLEATGIRSLAKVGDVFNPHVHQAVMSEGEGDIVEISAVHEQGYAIDDEVLKPALVSVISRK